MVVGFVAALDRIFGGHCHHHVFDNLRRVGKPMTRLLIAALIALAVVLIAIEGMP